MAKINPNEGDVSNYDLNKRVTIVQLITLAKDKQHIDDLIKCLFSLILNVFQLHQIHI